MHSSLSARFGRVRRTIVLLGLVTLTLGVLAPVASAVPPRRAVPAAGVASTGLRRTSPSPDLKRSTGPGGHTRQAKAVWDAPPPTRSHAQTPPHAQAAAACAAMTRFTDCETRTGRVLWLVDGVPQ